jgi:hypothetical protein
MKRFCLPGLHYSQCMIWPSIPAEIITSAIPGQSQSSPAQSTLIDKTGLVPTL